MQFISLLMGMAVALAETPKHEELKKIPTSPRPTVAADVATFRDLPAVTIFDPPTADDLTRNWEVLKACNYPLLTRITDRSKLPAVLKSEAERRDNQLVLFIAHGEIPLGKSKGLAVKTGDGDQLEDGDAALDDVRKSLASAKYRNVWLEACYAGGCKANDVGCAATAATPACVGGMELSRLYADLLCEAHQKNCARFAKYDRNGDGILTGDELVDLLRGEHRNLERLKVAHEMEAQEDPVAEFDKLKPKFEAARKKLFDGESPKIITMVTKSPVATVEVRFRMKDAKAELSFRRPKEGQPTKPIVKTPESEEIFFYLSFSAPDIQKAMEKAKPFLARNQSFDLDTLYRADATPWVSATNFGFTLKDVNKNGRVAKIIAGSASNGQISAVERGIDYEVSGGNLATPDKFPEGFLQDPEPRKFALVIPRCAKKKLNAQ